MPVCGRDYKRCTHELCRSNDEVIASVCRSNDEVIASSKQAHDEKDGWSVISIGCGWSLPTSIPCHLRYRVVGTKKIIYLESDRREDFKYV